MGSFVLFPINLYPYPKTHYSLQKSHRCHHIATQSKAIIVTKGKLPLHLVSYNVVPNITHQTTYIIHLCFIYYKYMNCICMFTNNLMLGIRCQFSDRQSCVCDCDMICLINSVVRDTFYNPDLIVYSLCSFILCLITYPPNHFTT